MQDGRFRYVDRSAQPAAEVELRAVDFRASDLSPDAPVRFELEAALGAARPNLEVSGTLGPLGSDAPALDIELALGPLPAESVLALGPVRQSLPEGLEVVGPVRLDASAAGTADALRFEAELDAESAAVTLGEGFSKPAGVPLRLALRGERSGDAASVESFEIRVDDAALRGRAKIASLERQSAEFSASSEALPLAPLGAGEPGDVLRDLSLEGTLAGERITARLRSPSGVLRGTRYADLAVDLALTGGRIEIEKAHMQAWGGTVSATGTYDTSAARPRFDLRTRAEQVSVGELLAERAPAAAARLTGTLDQELQLRGQGSGWEQIKPLLSGDGSLRLSSGIIKKINALAVYFRALGVIPFLADQGVVRFVDAHPELFLAEDTPYDRIGSLLQIRDGWVLLPDLELVKESYQLRSVRPGRYSLDHDLDLPLELVLSQPLSAEAVGYADRLRYFRGADGRLVLPLSVRGIPPIPTPDPQVLAGVAARAGASILVEKLLGSPPRSEQAPAGEEPGPAQPPAPEDVGAELLRRGLEGLLRGSDE